MLGRLANLFVFLVIVALGAAVWFNYARSNHDYFRSAAPNGQLEVVLRVERDDAESPSGDVTVSVERGGDAQQLAVLKGAHLQGGDEVLWSANGGTFLLVSKMTMGDMSKVPAQLTLTDGRWIYVYYDVANAEALINPVAGAGPVLESQHLEVQWLPSVEPLLQRPADS